MFKTSKQSLIDWQVTKDGKSFAWITKYKGARAYVVTFYRQEGECAGFKTLRDAKAFATA